MSDDEDIELQALQRRLDDAFQTTRPRAGFQDELWSKIQTRRPMWSRVGDFFAGLFASIRQAPAPAAAVAVVLVLALGLGIIARGGIHIGGAGGAATSSQFSETGAGTQRNAGNFGHLPLPAASSVPPKLAVPAPDQGGPSYANSYAGPVNLVWAGQFTFSVTSAPVYRYYEPSAQAVDQFASSLGASRAQSSYAGSGFVLAVTGTNGSLGHEPFFAITPDRSKLPAPGPTPMDTANAFLAVHNLLPVWPYTVTTINVADVVRVLYLRHFDLPGTGAVYVIDGAGERYGIEVDLRGGQPLQAFGPMPLNLDAADYPLISADRAVRSALATSPKQTTSNIPTVRLTSVELAYALAIAGDHSFYEPVFLFSGTFTQNGVVYVKHVVVPAVGP